MHSRAFLLLQRDLMNLKRYPLQGIDAYPSEGNMFKWYARIEGLIGTIWEDGIFYVSLTFDEDYDTVPPFVHFNTIPFHPNVSASDGGVAITEKCWIKGQTVSGLLLTLQVLLSNPELESECILNESAAKLLTRAPRTYGQTIMDCVLASIKNDGGFPDLELMDDNASVEDEKHLFCSEGRQTEEMKTIPIKLVSFDDYYVLWKGIATSIVDYKHSHENNLVQLLEKDRHFIAAHTKNDLYSIPLKEQRKNYAALKYGTLKKMEEDDRPGTNDTEKSLFDDKEVANNIKWSQSNHEKELAI